MIGVYMANFDSPIGKKQFANNQMREFNIPDESTNKKTQQTSVYDQVDYNYIQPPDYYNTAEIEGDIRRAKADKKDGIQRLTDAAKRRIEMLVGLTRSTKSIDIEGTVFLLKTLRSKEMSDALLAASNFDHTVESPFEIRKQLLARSICQVAGVDIEQFLNSSDIEDKCEFINLMDEAVLQRLYSEYILLNKDAKARFSIKTPDEGKEVVEDLKK
jgi:hypothetical protein